VREAAGGASATLPAVSNLRTSETAQMGMSKAFCCNLPTQNGQSEHARYRKEDSYADVDDKSIPRLLAFEYLVQFLAQGQIFELIGAQILKN
jgi:hypothetical protein